MKSAHDRAIMDFDAIVCPLCGMNTPVAEHCIYCGGRITVDCMGLFLTRCSECGLIGPSGDYCGACGHRMPPWGRRAYLREEDL